MTSVVRGILMKLIYQCTYEIIYNSMADGQKGARKNGSVSLICCKFNNE